MRAEAVAKLTTAVACHELWRTRGGYHLTTTVDGFLVSDKQLPTSEAMEWCETVKRCGGVVHEREVVRDG